MKMKLHQKGDFVYAKLDADENERHEISQVATAMMQKYQRELKRDLGVDVNWSWRLLMDEAKKDKALRSKLLERHMFHMVSYGAEAMMHVYLGNDWKLIFKYNDPMLRYAQPDGVLKDGTPYDAYCRSKNRWGLSKRPKENIGAYVLTHYYAGHFFLVGYAILAELKNGTPEKWGCYSVPINDLHPVKFLNSDFLAGLEDYISKSELYLLQDQLSS